HDHRVAGRDRHHDEAGAGGLTGRLRGRGAGLPLSRRIRGGEAPHNPRIACVSDRKPRPGGCGRSTEALPMAELNGTTFLSGANAEFIAELYARYLDDPNAVDPSWRRFFADMADDATAIRAERNGPPWARPLPPIEMPEAPSPTPAVDGGAVQQAAIDSIRALNLIRSYRVRGHLEADLDPLHL